jgi:endonuclease YncB( thermonuclease family)
MKSFAGARQRLVAGVILECVENTKRTELSGTRRRVEKVQTNAIACYQLPLEPNAQLIWTYFPPAKMVEILDADTFRLTLHRDMPQFTVTLRFCGIPAEKEAAP